MRIETKTIGMIFISFFQQNFFGTLNVVLAFLVLFITSIVSLGINRKLPPQDFSLWMFFFIPLLIMSFDSGIHLKNLAKNRASALLPHYRSYLSITVALIIGLFTFLPIILMGVRHGVNILPALAFFLFIPGLLCWSSFIIGDNIIVLATVLWVGKLTHELLGFKLSTMFLGESPRLILLGTPEAFPVLLIILSIGLWAFFFRYFSKTPLHSSRDESRHRSNPYMKHYDRVNGLMEKMIRWNIRRLIKGMKGNGKKSSLQLAQVLQYSFFSPGFVSPFSIGFILLLLLFYLSSLLHIFYGELLTAREFSFILVLTYYIGSCILTTDFLQHRHRLGAAWMWFPLSSRKTFTGTTLLAYSIVSFKLYLICSLGMVLFPLFSPIRIHMEMAHIVGLGFFITVNMLSLSLLFSNRVKSPDCRAWVLSCSFMAPVLIVVINEGLRRLLENQATEGWTIAAMTILTITLLGRAYRKWSQTEMNFEGPEIGY